MIRYLGVLDGGALATGNVREPSHVLMIESLGTARATLTEAANSGRIYSALALDTGALPLPIPGGLGEGAQLTLWRLPHTYPYRHRVATDSTERATDAELANAGWRSLVAAVDPYPDFILTLGARGGVHTERA